MYRIKSVCYRVSFLFDSFLISRLRKVTAKSSYSLSSIPKEMSTSKIVKSPNVMIYTGDDHEDVFKNAADVMMRCLHPDKYVLYELKKSEVLIQSWQENTVLLLVICDSIEDVIADAFRNYLANGGKILSICSNLDVPEVGLTTTVAKDGVVKIKFKNMDCVEVYHGKISTDCSSAQILASDVNNVPAIMKFTVGQGVLISSDVNLVLNHIILLKADNTVSASADNNLKILKDILEEIFGLEVFSVTISMPSPGYAIYKTDTDLHELLQELQIQKDHFKILEKSSSGIIDKRTPLETSVPYEIILNTSEATGDSVQFDKTAYFSSLKTKNFGRIVIFFPVITSTMEPVEYVSNVEGIVIVARRQTSGRGRGANAWISPEGCAMFTLHFSISLFSQLGQRLSLVQHMTSLAVVHSIQKIPGYEKLNLHLKWPNDIYWENDKKIGGVLVKTTIQGNQVHVYVGVGINVSNERPTVCINNAIDTHNTVTGNSLPYLKIEEVIACTLSELEYLMNDFTERGSKNFLQLYYSYWLHENQRVTLSNYQKEAIIKGLDDFGYLIVETDDGEKLVLQPDGNRFDMMKNFIVSKS